MPQNDDMSLQGYSFNTCPKFFDGIEQKELDKFLKPIKYVNTLACLGCSFNGLILNISEKATRIDRSAFAEIKASEVIIGGPGKPSQLNSIGTALFATSSVSKITIYTDDTSKPIWNTFRSNVGNSAEVQIISA